MTYAFRTRAVRHRQSQILAEALAALRSAGPRAFVFDLDSTVLDNRPRQARIVREYAARHAQPRLSGCLPEHMVSWDLRDTAQLCGYSKEEAELIYPAFKEFWRARFFTSAYCQDDLPVPGATKFLDEVRKAGGRIIYVTGRHVGMGEGTVESFRRARFPLPEWPLGPGKPPDEAPVQLWLKNDPQGDDDLWKESCHVALEAQGGVAAAFDNEPTHVNAYKRSFPGAHVIHLDSDHSGRPVEVLASIASIADFVMEP